MQADERYASVSFWDYPNPINRFAASRIRRHRSHGGLLWAIGFGGGLGLRAGGGGRRMAIRRSRR